DQEEAIGMADRICVMQAGHIRQLGSPHELYYRPNCEFVARFFGENNLVAGTLGETQGEFRAIETALGRLVCSVAGQPHLKAAATGARGFAAFRPEALRFAGESDAGNRLSGTVADVAFAGSSTVATITAGGDAAQRLRLRFPSRVEGSALRAGETVALSFAPHEGHLVLA
ncbi:MAG: TOBE domain-containing protein, partial [Hyphomicrobiales bacterium]